jgi:hypothetical protein
MKQQTHSSSDAVSGQIIGEFSAALREVYFGSRKADERIQQFIALAAQPFKASNGAPSARFNSFYPARATHETSIEFAEKRQLARVAGVLSVLRYRVYRVGDVRPAGPVHPQGHRDVAGRVRPSCG